MEEHLAGNLSVLESEQNTTALVMDSQREFSHDRTVQHVLDQYITPTICGFGFLGNVVNLIVLTRRHFRRSESGKETVAHLGLILLAISEMLFCLVLFPRAFIRTTRTAFDSLCFALYYQAYSTGLVNTFIFTSTWITVALAALRYVGICHPFRARLIEDVSYIKVLFTAIFLCCVAFNLPWYWHYQIKHVRFNNTSAHLLIIGFFDENRSQGKVFKWFRAVLGIFLPALLLIFCNCSLIHALRRSFRLRRQYCTKDVVSRSKNRITLLLVVIAMLFVVLVFPSELLDFFLYSGMLDTTSAETFLVWRAITNLLQVINFACNFLLYCVINTHFRAALKETFTCSASWCMKRAGHHNHLPLRHVSFRTSRTMNVIM